ncbi:hypothetical protein HDU92_001601 [Lobulomyces angularis]|nr:hypothetical protein HDU92_001601 [Lobulomyces angularis]
MIVHTLKEYPKFLDHIALTISFLLNSVVMAPILFDYICYLTDANWTSDNGIGLCNCIVDGFFINYQAFFSFSIFGGLLQVFAIPIFETLLGLSVAIILMKVRKISNNFKKAKKGRLVNDLKIRRVETKCKTFFVNFLLIVWVSGFANVLAQGNWVLYTFSADENVNKNYYAIFNSLGNLLVGVEFLFYYKFMEKLTALILIGSGQIPVTKNCKTNEKVNDISQLSSVSWNTESVSFLPNDSLSIYDFYARDSHPKR